MHSLPSSLDQNFGATRAIRDFGCGCGFRDSPGRLLRDSLLRTPAITPLHNLGPCRCARCENYTEDRPRESRFRAGSPVRRRMPDHVQRFHPILPLPCTRDAIAAPTDASTLRPERGLTCSVPTDRRRRPGAGVEGAAGKGQRAKGRRPSAEGPSGTAAQVGPGRPRSAQVVDVDLDRRPRPSLTFHSPFSPFLPPYEWHAHQTLSCSS